MATALNKIASRRKLPVAAASRRLVSRRKSRVEWAVVVKYSSREDKSIYSAFFRAAASFAGPLFLLLLLFDNYFCFSTLGSIGLGLINKINKKIKNRREMARGPDRRAK